MFAPDTLFYGTTSIQRAFSNTLGSRLDRPDITQATPLKITSRALSDSVVLISGRWKVDRTLDGKTTVGGSLRVTAVLQKRNDR
jgi:hypothetical protein